ncbi:XRE family transcriptional regulator [Aureimonas flava]|uniref:XRE family transcriptional regulator n=1 Tax=Aureimonas flava TaxID=2320271 RepID=A0A3A1WL78_9HYPH|nr:helix-turn-helix transcriptional regulator [Aureimonas flava]RIY02058.1 XRE family transcriptional regulator [Aureimonas flava]
MDSDSFREWRRALGWKQREAADRLGLKKRVIQYYEKGDRGGKQVEIPRAVELACLALAMGIDRYDGRALPRDAADLLGRSRPPGDPSTIASPD